MSRLYSQTTQTTYLTGVHSVLPADAVAISEALYLSVIGNPPPGKVRAHDDRGLPYLIDAPVPLPDLETQEREWRDSELIAVTGMRDRHRDQLEIEVETTLTAEQFRELLVYIQALRDWPQSPEFPVLEQRPAAPPWIAEKTQ